ncbi:hypothetical protein AWJ20_5093 [Sugiyamaella lignohabitans]|uniref:HbrB n=1 Tax=Sugiyamaella lignohabitans TaxID=796027 RepID=A0A167EIY7_9ASCO|nr:uncharacterized protein AWJ20_5093 [Sugiyamaella lignohabitans]ANB14135.1 hypothetical protein AWJ20_5093 [Sugiyamaella lignohabitans]
MKRNSFSHSRTRTNSSSSSASSSLLSPVGMQRTGSDTSSPAVTGTAGSGQSGAVQFGSQGPQGGGYTSSPGVIGKRQSMGSMTSSSRLGSIQSGNSPNNSSPSEAAAKAATLKTSAGFANSSSSNNNNYHYNNNNNYNSNNSGINGLGAGNFNATANSINFTGGNSGAHGTSGSSGGMGSGGTVSQYPNTSVNLGMENSSGYVYSDGGSGLGLPITPSASILSSPGAASGNSGSSSGSSRSSIARNKISAAAAASAAVFASKPKESALSKAKMFARQATKPHSHTSGGGSGSSSSSSRKKNVVDLTIQTSLPPISGRPSISERSPLARPSRELERIASIGSLSTIMASDRTSTTSGTAAGSNNASNGALSGLNNGSNSTLIGSSSSINGIVGGTGGGAGGSGSVIGNGVSGGGVGGSSGAGASGGVGSGGSGVGSSVSSEKIKHHLTFRPRKDSHGLSSSSSNSKLISEQGSIYSFNPSSPGVVELKNMGTKEERDQVLDRSWSLLRSRVIGLFSGDGLRVPVEDLNNLILMHMSILIQQGSSATARLIMNEFKELLRAGMYSFEVNLVKSDNTVILPNLVKLWVFFFTDVLPYLEAIFLPLQCEFQGTGKLLSPDNAPPFWKDIAAKDPLDTRRFILMSFRDHVIIPVTSRLESAITVDSLDFNSSTSSSLSDLAVRILQCINVLSLIQSSNSHQAQIDHLALVVRKSWLSRPRAGKDRRGVVMSRR